MGKKKKQRTGIYHSLFFRKGKTQSSSGFRSHWLNLAFEETTKNDRNKKQNTHHPPYTNKTKKRGRVFLKTDKTKPTKEKVDILVERKKERKRKIVCEKKVEKEREQRKKQEKEINGRKR